MLYNHNFISILFLLNLQTYPLFTKMQAHTKLNGSTTKKGNYIWGAALTLAWKHLIKEIIHEPIKIKSSDKKALEITDNFNQSPCDFDMMSPECYYARAGFGNKTVHLINEEVAQKFPEKTTPKVEANMQDDSIISYAYFFKKLLFEHPFLKKTVHFSGKSVPGFGTKTLEHKKQILVSEYTDHDNFLIELKTKNQNDHIFLYKTTKDHTPEQVLQKLSSTKHATEHIGHDDTFQMPNITIKNKRDVKQLVGTTLLNQKFKEYFFAQIYEIINLDLDETGVKVENEGVIKMMRSGIPFVNRKFVLDKPFWIVMREKNNHPYFVAHIVEVEDKGEKAQ